MQEIIQFVSNLITEGVAYDSLKVILGSSFNKLTSYLSNNEKEKFEGALEILLEQNRITEDKFKTLETNFDCNFKDDFFEKYSSLSIVKNKMEELVAE